jgi:radical SAM protein with 4Fe4S-binding SPASM domain
MVRLKPNANFYSLISSSEHTHDSEEYKEYRRSWIELPQKFVVRDFPMHIDIEISSRCNLRCTFCDKLAVLRQDQLGQIDMDLYRRIIDEGSAHKLWGIKLSYRGEPLLHPDVAAIVAYAKKKGILDVYFNTNGMLLDAGMSKRLIDAGLDRISVSVEGIDPQVFEKERVGAKFDVILRNIETLNDLKKKMNVQHPLIRVQTVLYPGLDLESYKSFWSSRCDEVAAVDYKDGATRHQGLTHEWGCPQLWQRITIEWDGTVHPCNNDDSGLMPLFNVKEKNVYDCWHDEKINEIRRLHRTGMSHEVHACNGCPWRTAQIQKLLVGSQKEKI